ncbi:Subtilisin-like protease [Acorus calamus]|uniref:Subtilisin-like protease n=1 Tax=Acorus calamus TaxID=4465 RepID=A0AAV9FDL5_ACOCL|nr:Subtilisin-like protease [Acorus calamus]
MATLAGSSTVTALALYLLLLLCLLHPSLSARNDGRKTYIVHVSKSQKPSEFSEHRHWYDASLSSVTGRPAEILYTYETVVHGFSTRLTDSEASALGDLPGVLAVLPEVRYELHTTRTPEFLGLDRNEWLVPSAGSNAGLSDVVVGVLDTGVWPELKSYDDTGLGPVPSSWKGECEAGKNFDPSKACNKKLVGARYFSKAYEASMGPIDESRESKSPRDDDGHGTHTSTTAAGASVPGASLLGYAPGTARGMATRARVATYKVCWTGGCFSSDILSAMDKAVSDGVDVLSMSLGGGSSDYFRDSVAIGAFAAMESGVLVSCSAGNGGPGPSSLSNVAPWITTVGAGTLDRDFPAVVSLGNGKNYTGVSLYSGKYLTDTPTIPLIYAGNATNATNGNLCMTGTLIPEKVAGKIVLCDRGINARVQKGSVVKDAGGAGMILANTAANGEELVADAHLLPATGVGQKSGEAIKSYLFSSSNPTATIVFSGTKVGIEPSPVVAAFSSRGPNPITIDVLKPDLIAPGVNILAGWTGAVGPTGMAVDTRRVEFNIISGTSMSCPHVSGLAALLKGVHPGWSPAAVRSALMTSAYNTYKAGDKLIDVATGKAATPFDLGAGHVEPTRALDPGLVYDLTVEDYLDFLCALNYTSIQIESLARKSYACASAKKYSVSDLNYPSFAVNFATALSGAAETTGTLKHTRTLTNVGTPGTYKATVYPSTGPVKVAVVPDTLVFSQANEKKSYTVTFSAESQPSGSASFGRLEWSDGAHIVGSPIAYTWT